MTTTCPRCKSTCWDTDRFCPTCGTALQQDDAANSGGRVDSWEYDASTSTGDDSLEFTPLEFDPAQVSEPDRGRGLGWMTIALAVLVLLIVAALVVGAWTLMSDDDSESTDAPNTAAIANGALIAANGLAEPGADDDRRASASSLAEDSYQAVSQLRGTLDESADASNSTGDPVAADDRAVPSTGDGTGGMVRDLEATIPLIGPQQPPDSGNE